MSEQRGYYLMHRGWLDHPALTDGEFCRRAMWCDMIEMAAWRSHRRNVAGKTIELQRGEFTASLRFLAARWGCSKAKVERLVSRLKTETMIETRTETGQLVIRICNYERFQRVPDETETPSETLIETEAGQQRDSSETKENTSNSINTMKGSLFGPEEQKPSRRKPETPFPETEEFKQACLAMISNRRPELDAAAVFEGFRDHAQINDRRCRDWLAAARMWTRKERAHGTTQQSRPAKRGNYDAAIAGAAAALGRSRPRT